VNVLRTAEQLARQGPPQSQQQHERLQSILNLVLRQRRDLMLGLLLRLSREETLTEEELQEMSIIQAAVRDWEE